MAVRNMVGTQKVMELPSHSALRQRDTERLRPRTRSGSDAILKDDMAAGRAAFAGRCETKRTLSRTHKSRFMSTRCSRTSRPRSVLEAFSKSWVIWWRYRAKHRRV